MGTEIDLTTAKVVKLKMYGGKSGSKICIEHCGSKYMLKFPAPANLNPNMSYRNSSICEHIACRVFKSLGLETQSTFLCTYKGKTAVACKDFETDGYLLKEFAHLKNTIIDSSNSGYGTELFDIIETINIQEIYDRDSLMCHFWDMFICDALLGNFDRHNGNWGFLINADTGDVRIAPIFDCGSCLYPQMDETMMQSALSDYKEIEKRLYSIPSSAIRTNNVKLKYYHFLTTTDNTDCQNSLIRIGHSIDLSNINGIIDDTPYITNLHKQFLKTIIKERKEKIIDKAIERISL